jgi:hypothetical protein
MTEDELTAVFVTKNAFKEADELQKEEPVQVEAWIDPIICGRSSLATFADVIRGR